MHSNVAYTVAILAAVVVLIALVAIYSEKQNVSSNSQER
jgi:uncharacterized membrane protein YuzA (DUF378 family)